MEYVKLTDKDMRAFNGYQWVVGEKRTASGAGELGKDGWLYCYGAETQKQALLLAELLHILNVNYPVRRFFAAKCGGQIRSDAGVKFGVTEMTLGEELSPPIVTTVNRVAFTILCAMEFVKDRTFVAWGEGWLSGKDRSAASAAALEEWAADRALAVRAAWSAWAALETARAARSLEAAWAAALAVESATASGCSIPLGELAEKAMEIS